MSEPVNGVSERSERSEAERCGASERSERCERTNIASDRVALSKRGCLRLETRPLSDEFLKKTKVSVPKVLVTPDVILMERR